MFIRASLAGLALTAMVVTASLQLDSPDRSRDLFAYHNAAERVQTGGSMYDQHISPGPHTPEDGVHLPYLYPPFLAAALSLLPRMDAQSFSQMWMLMLYLAFWTFAVCLQVLRRRRVGLYGVLAWGVGLAFVVSVTGSLGLGQVDVIIWALLALAFTFPAFAGVGFAVVGLLKLFGAWAIVAAVLRRDWRTVSLAGISVGIAVLIGILALGPGGLAVETLRWARDVLPSLAQGQFVSARLGGGLLALWDSPATLINLSPTILPLRALGYGDGPLPAPARVYLLAVSLGAPLAMAWFHRKSRPEVHYLWTIAAALVFAPICRPAYLVALLPGVVLVTSRHRGGLVESPAADPRGTDPAEA